MFSQELINFNPRNILADAAAPNGDKIQAVLAKQKLSLHDFAVLLQPEAQAYLEEMALLARNKTLKRFGYTVSLFSPLYLSNDCINSCAYCSFNRTLGIEHKTLSKTELEAECAYLKAQGFEHVLLVSSENPLKVDLEYLKYAVRCAKKYFHHVAIEVYSLPQNFYQALKDEGLDGVTLFQETYNPKQYGVYHPAGPKKYFEKRLDTMDLAARGGVRKLNLGCLLGLYDFKEDALSMIFHLEYLKKHYWQCEYGVSLPRIRKNAGNFEAPFPVSDIEFVQLILALRLFDENLCLTLSTRETQEFRNHLIPLGITQMSAGAKTNPGGYAGEASEAQFQVSDERSPQEIIRYLESIGYEPVWKDWERAI